MKVHELVSDELWVAIGPRLPAHPPQPQGGNAWKPDRAALCGIISVLKTGLQWQMLPMELGCGSGSTCWRRLRDQQAAGVWHLCWPRSPSARNSTSVSRLRADEHIASPG